MTLIFLGGGRLPCWQGFQESCPIREGGGNDNGMWHEDSDTGVIKRQVTEGGRHVLFCVIYVSLSVATLTTIVSVSVCAL